MVTALPARQSAQQPEHLAVSKGTSCGLCPLGLCLRDPDGHLWKISTTKTAKTAPPTTHHDQGQLATRYEGLTFFMCPTLSGTSDHFIHDKQYSLWVASRQKGLITFINTITFPLCTLPDTLQGGHLYPHRFTVYIWVKKIVLVQYDGYRMINCRAQSQGSSSFNLSLIHW